MRTLFALLLIALLPTAGATGYLLNVNVGSTQVAAGLNPFGGSGDTLDIGLLHAQCSDEADVVDVNVLGTEGRGACAEEPRCAHTEPGDPLDPILPIEFLPPPGGEPTDATCSDDRDTVDVSVLATEGARELRCEEGGKCEETYEGDAHDASDVTIGGLEYGDQDDGNDLGVLNCEYLDGGDATDVGVLNTEWMDGGDTFDLGLVHSQTGNQGDANGLGLGGTLGLHPRCVVVGVEGPSAPLARLLP